MDVHHHHKANKWPECYEIANYKGRYLLRYTSIAWHFNYPVISLGRSNINDSIQNLAISNVWSELVSLVGTPNFLIYPVIMLPLVAKIIQLKRMQILQRTRFIRFYMKEWHKIGLAHLLSMVKYTFAWKVWSSSSGRCHSLCPASPLLVEFLRVPARTAQTKTIKYKIICNFYVNLAGKVK